MKRIALAFSRRSIAAALITAMPILPLGGQAGAQQPADQTEDVKVDALPLSGPALLLFRNAELAIRDGNPTKAASDLTEAVRQRPDCAKLRAALVSALRAGGREGEASATAKAAASDDRIPAEGQKRLEAMAQTGDVIRTGPPTPDASTTCDFQMQPAPPAITDATATTPQVSETDPAYEAAAAAYSAYDRADYHLAVTEAEKAVSLAPDNEAYNTLLKNARTALTLSTAKPPPPSPAFTAASNAYAALRANNLAGALRDAREAARLQPSNRSYQLLLIDVLNRSGGQTGRDRCGQPRDRPLRRGSHAAWRTRRAETGTWRPGGREGRFRARPDAARQIAHRGRSADGSRRGVHRRQRAAGGLSGASAPWRQPRSSRLADARQGADGKQGLHCGRNSASTGRSACR